jgi:hypothetical protein
LVTAGLVPAIPIVRHCAILIGIAGTSPAMAPRVLLNPSYSGLMFADFISGHHFSISAFW